MERCSDILNVRGDAIVHRAGVSFGEVWRRFAVSRTCGAVADLDA